MALTSITSRGSDRRARCTVSSPVSLLTAHHVTHVTCHMSRSSCHSSLSSASPVSLLTARFVRVDSAVSSVSPLTARSRRCHHSQLRRLCVSVLTARSHPCRQLCHHSQIHSHLCHYSQLALACVEKSVFACHHFIVNRAHCYSTLQPCVCTYELYFS